MFATTNILALDEGSAAMRARTAIEELLDLLRFDYETQVVKVDRRCLVRREGDGRVELLEIRHVVPNPRLAGALDDFNKLAKQVEAVLTKENVEAVSRQQLQCAIRQYRFGSDAEGYRDKFTAWWTGLEALTSIGQGTSIGGKVMFNASRAMLSDYVHRLLRDLLDTLRYLRIAWSNNLAGHSGCPDIESLTVPKLLQILLSPPHAKTLLDQCAPHPVVAHFGKQLQDALSDPARLLDRIEEHRRHLEWQLNRLYRIRCCIVHGSPIRFNLALFAANLEFYLKEIIRFVITTFNNYDHIVGLDELFHRAASRYDRARALLADAGADAVPEAVFMDVVVTQTPA